MTARELIGRASITEVWLQLGGPELRHNRGPAFWRDGDGLNVSIDEGRGVFFDHARNEGGGILDFVQAVHGCSRQDALRWVANFYAMPLDDGKPVLTAERRSYAERHGRAKQQAEELADWREVYLHSLTQRRSDFWDSGHADIKSGAEDFVTNVRFVVGASCIGHAHADKTPTAFFCNTCHSSEITTL